MSPTKHTFHEPLITSYDVLKALWHLLPLLVSRSPVLFQQYEDKNRTGVEPGLT